MSHKFGKLPVRKDYRTLQFKNYLTDNLPAVQPTYDVLPTVYARIGETDPSVVFPLDGNDYFGNCTIAGLCHASTIYHALIGKKLIEPAYYAIALYLYLTKGLDTGLVELDVLNRWKKNSQASEVIVSYASINHKNHDHVKLAISLFGCVYLGFQVQENAISDFESRTTWTPGPLTQGGHAVVATSYDADTVTVLTWGNTQKGTWEWWDECVEEVYAIIPQEAKIAGYTNGFNFEQLESDLQALSNGEFCTNS